MIVLICQRVGELMFMLVIVLMYRCADLLPCLCDLWKKNTFWGIFDLTALFLARFCMQNCSFSARKKKILLPSKTPLGLWIIFFPSFRRPRNQFLCFFLWRDDPAKDALFESPTKTGKFTKSGTLQICILDGFDIIFGFLMEFASWKTIGFLWFSAQVHFLGRKRWLEGKMRG
jgi:hypothetical protein